jgi:hypothetical protein
MPMTFVKPEELDSYIGKSLEPSEWLANSSGFTNVIGIMFSYM